MKIPVNKTEKEVLEEIDRIVNILAYKFKFGYYDVEDIKQEGRIEGIKALDKYDENLPLPNFLYSHIRNRLTNLIRDKYHRNDPPCKMCHGVNQGHTEHKDGKFCEQYIIWKNRNERKANLVCPTDISNIDDTEEKNTKVPDSVSDNLIKKEVFDLIDLKLPVSLRADYLKLRSGVNIPKIRKDLIVKTIKDFLTDEEIDDLYG